MNLRKAVEAIERHGILLVYPIDNRKEPPSLWSVFYPRSEMRWEWDETGDDRVGRLWHLREELSRSGKVVYAKWYRGRATFFSRGVFASMLAVLGGTRLGTQGLSPVARELYEALTLDSPMSTKQIKMATGYRGKAYEAMYERAMKELWSRLLIVGFGEIDDGAFPSLAVGSTKLLFEDLWNEASEKSAEEGWEHLREVLPGDSLFLKKLGEKPRARRNGLKVEMGAQPDGLRWNAFRGRKPA